MTFVHDLQNSKMLLKDGGEESEMPVLLVGVRSSFARKLIIEETLDILEG